MVDEKNKWDKDRKTVYINDDKWDQLRIKAIKNKTNATSIIEKLVDLYLKGKVKI